MEWGFHSPVKVRSNGNSGLTFEYDCYGEQGSALIEYNAQKALLACYLFNQQGTQTHAKEDIYFNELIDSLDEMIRLRGKTQEAFLNDLLSTAGN